MIEKQFEFDSVISANKYQRMNQYQKPKYIRGIRDRIMLVYGEGPYKKVHIDKSLPKVIKQQVKKELMSSWPEKRFAIAEYIIRSNIRDIDNYHGIFKPYNDALTRSGWIVDDNKKWFLPLLRDAVKGDNAIFLRLYLAENDNDENKLRAEAERIGRAMKVRL